MALNRPQRRTYVTGQSLPAVTTSFRPFTVAPSEDDNELGAVRAFTVNIRNRSETSSIYIKEGEDGDEVEIAPHEHYPIYEPNGIKSISLKGDSGGEVVEIRAFVGHNDFSVQDKIDGFLRSLSSYIGTATRDTRITAQDVDLSIDDVGGIDVNTGNVTIDDIQSTSTTFDGDITGQTNFDLRTYPRGGQVVRRVLNTTNVQIVAQPAGDGWIENTWTVFDPASQDLLLETAEIRLSGSLESWMDYYGPRIQVDKGNTGSWETAGPRRGICRAYASQLSSPQDPFVTGNAYNSKKEVSWTLNFPFGMEIREGDGLRLVFDGYTKDPTTGSAEADIETELIFTTRNRVNP